MHPKFSCLSLSSPWAFRSAGWHCIQWNKGHSIQPQTSNARFAFKKIHAWHLPLASEKDLRGAVARTYWINSHQVGRELELRPGEGSRDPKLFLGKILLMSFAPASGFRCLLCWEEIVAKLCLCSSPKPCHNFPPIICVIVAVITLQLVSESRYEPES